MIERRPVSKREGPVLERWLKKAALGGRLWALENMEAWLASAYS